MSEALNPSFGCDKNRLSNLEDRPNASGSIRFVGKPSRASKSKTFPPAASKNGRGPTSRHWPRWNSRESAASRAPPHRSLTRTMLSRLAERTRDKARRCSSSSMANWIAHRLVWGELPAGVRANSLAEVLASEPELLEGRLGALTDLKVQPLVALQTAFLHDGAVVTVAPGTQVDQAIRLRFISTGEQNDNENSASIHSASFPRLLVIVGKGSSLELLQEHVCESDAPGLTAYVAEFHLAEDARVETLEIQSEDASRIHFTSAHARLEKNATFDSHVISLGDGLVRSESSIRLTEPNAETTLCGLFMGRNRGHLDHFTTVDHEAPGCTSDEEYRGILADDSKGVFRGRVIVRPDAQKTDAKQSNPNLLLSDRATIDTKPQLEIYADDIRASHGSTIGQLDEASLFFLRARGIDPEGAKRLLTRAFAHGVIARIESETLSRVATAHVDAKLDLMSVGATGVSQ